MQLLERIGPATEKLKSKGIDFSLWYKPESLHADLWDGQISVYLLRTLLKKIAAAQVLSPFVCHCYPIFLLLVQTVYTVHDTFLLIYLIIDKWFELLNNKEKKHHIRDSNVCVLAA